MNEYHPLLGSEFAIRRSPPLVIRALPDSARFNLRIDPDKLERASQVFGLSLPAKIGGAVVSNSKIAICLGPDEWQLIAPSDTKETVENAFAAFYDAAPHSLVDISHREIGIEIDGADAALALSSTVAFDIKRMPINSGCRTVLDKAQIILLRETERRFRIEVWNSFATHVWGLLTSASREIELEI